MLWLLLGYGLQSTGKLSLALSPEALPSKRAESYNGKGLML